MNEIEIYKTTDGQTEIEVKFQEDTVWLTQSQITELFSRDRTVITKHINNVFKDGELDEKSNVQKMHIANSDKPVSLYSLDVIISVGYRVNSKRGTQFRQWATQRLKDYLVKGYAINQKYLSENLHHLEQAANLLYFIIKNHPFSDGNKRIGAFIFVWFLEKNKHRFKKNGELKINDNALVALALLVAQSDPAEKELMVQLIVNLISTR